MVTVTQLVIYVSNRFIKQVTISAAQNIKKRDLVFLSFKVFKS